MKPCLTSCLPALAFAFCAASPAAIYQTKGGAELFVDDTIIAASAHLERVFHQAAKLDSPVLRAGKPWEEGRVYLYGGVHRNEKTGLFRMWYNAGGKICYAESQDGITWMRPEVGLHEYDGSRKNNILLTDVINTTVFIDEHCPDPLQKYKALIGSSRHFRGAYSADGINWKMYNGGEKLMAFGSEMATVSRDEKTGEYLAFIRPHPPKLNPKSMKEKRTCALTTSRDFINWSPLEMVFTPDEIDDQWLFSKGQRTEFYGWGGFKYGSQWLGFITVFRLTGTLAEKQKLQAAFDGPIDVQLIHSRDGRKWRRTLPRTPVIPNGPHGYDAGAILHIANNPLIVGDEVWLYYTAINTTHGGPVPPKDITIALAKWRLDGFASLRARWAPGVVQTVPMITDGGELLVNADMSRGQLTVALLDADGRAFPGFTENDCEIISRDSIRHRIRWKGGDQVPAGKPFALRFHLTNGDLYGFRIAAAE